MEREKEAPLALEKEAPTDREKEPVNFCSRWNKINIVTYLVKTGETPLLLCGLWFSWWLLKRTTSVVNDGKIKKMRGEGCCGGGRWLIVGWEKKIKRLSHWGILSEDFEFWVFNLGIFQREQWMWREERRLIDSVNNELHLIW
jgi:hypothetical protein